MKKRFLAILLVFTLSLALTVPVFAAENEPKVAKEYTYAYLLPDDAENIHYSYNGTIIFTQGNEYKFLDGQSGEIRILGVEHRSHTKSVNSGHVPADLGASWVFFHTDGPYECKYDLLNIWNFCESLGDAVEYAVIISELSVGLGVAVGVAVALYSGAVAAHNGGFTTKTSYWRVDDAYHLVDDYAMFHVESYWYSSAACTKLIDKEYKEWHG